MDAFRGNELLRREIAEIVRKWIAAHEALDAAACLEVCCEDVRCHVQGFGQFDGRHELRHYFDLRQRQSTNSPRGLIELEMFFRRGAVTCAGRLEPVSRGLADSHRHGIFLAHFRRAEEGWRLETLSLQENSFSLPRKAEEAFASLV